MSESVTSFWAEALHAFTQRNMSRAMDLQIISNDLGVQSEVRGMKLQGVAFDRHDGGVEIMLGGSGDRHITRSIPNVRSVDMVTGDSVMDDVLRVTHEDGMVILSATMNSREHV